MALNFTEQRRNSQARAREWAARAKPLLGDETRWNEIALDHPNEASQAKAFMAEILKETNADRYMNPNYAKKLLALSPMIAKQQELFALGGGGTGFGGPNATGTAPTPAGLGDFMVNWLNTPQGPSARGTFGFFTPDKMKSLWDSVARQKYDAESIRQGNKTAPDGSLVDANPIIADLTPQDMTSLYEFAFGMSNPWHFKRVSANPFYQLQQDDMENDGFEPWINQYMKYLRGTYGF